MDVYPRNSLYRDVLRIPIDLQPSTVLRVVLQSLLVVKYTAATMSKSA
jgi:hypothetical protein